ncbi:MAG: hypothetical protein AAFZ63_18900 [Bacteroidota bacterium]
MQIVFPITEAALYSVHQQEKHQEGEWMVYTCKQCPGYERRVHLSTGQVTQKGQKCCPNQHKCGR